MPSFALSIAIRSQIIQEVVDARKAGQRFLDVVAVPDADVLPDTEMRARRDEHRILHAQPLEQPRRRNRQPVLHEHDRTSERPDEAADVIVGVNPTLELRQIGVENRPRTREDLLPAHGLHGDTREAI